MDLVRDDLGRVFRRYLFPSMGSALIMTIYAAVDSIAVGQAEGPVGAAAMAVINPLYGVIVFLSLLCGIGGAVLMSSARGEGHDDEGHRWFSASLIVMGVLAAAVWLVLLLGHDRIFTAFGADAAVLALVNRYARWLIWTFPFFIAAIYLACFIRNDGDPGLAMRATLIGGALNIFGDWFFVFPLHMGISGAGLATMLSNFVQVGILCTHFFSAKNTIRLRKPDRIGTRTKTLLSVGFGAGMLDLANVILFSLVNNQLMRYGNVNYLAVFGAVSTIATLFQSFFGGIGQAMQPIASVNHGAHETGRTHRLLRMAMTVSISLGVVLTALCMAAPAFIVRLFMSDSDAVLAIAPPVVRLYSVLFLFMSANIISIYYLQATVHARASNTVSLLRGLIVSGIMVLALPPVLGVIGVWAALPLSEIFVCLVAVLLLVRVLRADRTA